MSVRASNNAFPFSNLLHARFSCLNLELFFKSDCRGTIDKCANSLPAMLSDIKEFDFTQPFKIQEAPSSPKLLRLTSKFCKVWLILREVDIDFAPSTPIWLLARIRSWSFDNASNFAIPLAPESQILFWEKSRWYERYLSVARNCCWATPCTILYIFRHLYC